MTQTMMVVYPFPIRKGQLAFVNVPRDLTQEEAERLCEFVRSLAQPAGVAPTDGGQKNG